MYGLVSVQQFSSVGLIDNENFHWKNCHSETTNHQHTIIYFSILFIDMVLFELVIEKQQTEYLLNLKTFRVSLFKS